MLLLPCAAREAPLPKEEFYARFCAGLTRGRTVTEIRRVTAAAGPDFELLTLYLKSPDFPREVLQNAAGLGRFLFCLRFGGVERLAFCGGGAVRETDWYDAKTEVTPAFLKGDRPEG